NTPLAHSGKLWSQPINYKKTKANNREMEAVIKDRRNNQFIPPLPIISSLHTSFN
ncbi:MAG: hypothetical protein ACI9G5_002572, partial [Paracoccaceae bacterium]